LHRDVPNPSGGRVDQYPLTFREPASVEESLPPGQTG